MSKKPGWYKDPWPGMPGEPPLLRYWDGRHWSDHARTAAEVMEPAYAGAGPGGVYAPAAPSYGAPVPPTTPDGQFLAGWWQRVWAYLIDAIITGVIGGVLAAPWWGDVSRAFGDFIDQVVRDAEAGRPMTDTAALEQAIAGPLLTIALINLAVGFVYHVGFLMALQATPGKLLLGLRVRLRDRPELPLWSVLLRWDSQFGYTILNLSLILGSVLWIYGLLDVLWPLWDGKKQAIHDKVARTNVVRSR
ncbi:MAG: RDD family protein [Nocardioidaceae bacterium]